jgi:DNA polymerase III epsilon subunit family exonuclease
MSSRRLVYPQLSKLALLALEEGSTGAPPLELAARLGLDAPGGDAVLELVLDGRFEITPERVGLRRWTRGFPPVGETIVALDLEATNGNPKTEDIIEIGAVKLSPAGREEFQSLVSPDRPLMPFVSKLTGITTDMLEHAPKAPEVLERFREFLGDATLVVQNASFDVALLTREFAKLSHKLLNPVVDTVDLAHAALPGKRKRGLDTLSTLYNVPQGSRHRALDDARITLSIAESLYFSLAAERDIHLKDLNHEFKHQPPSNPTQAQPGRSKSRRRHRGR